jgi:hypothetical protein
MRKRQKKKNIKKEYNRIEKIMKAFWRCERRAIEHSSRYAHRAMMTGRLGP